MFISKLQKGFTLIELMVVISIVSLLASVIAVSLTGAKAQADDAARKSELGSMRTALTNYKLDHNGKEPIPVKGGGGGGYGTIVTDANGDFQKTIQTLVDEHYLPKLPSQTGYFYFATTTDTGDDEAVIGATLQKAAPSLDGDSGSCRPFSNPRGQAQMEPPPPGGDPQIGQGWFYYRDPQGNILGSGTEQCDNNFDDDFDGFVDYNGGYDRDGNPRGSAFADPGCVNIDDNGESPDPSFETETPTYCSGNVANTDYCLCI